jgi:MFS transporter, DHA2 family, multidrug resistance protein
VSAALWPPTVAPGTLAPVLAVCGVGFGLFQVPSNRSMLLAAPRARSAAAGSVQSTARLSGQTLGGVLMTVLFTHHTAGLAPRLGLGLAATAVLLAGAVSTLRAQEAVRAAEV